MAPSKSVRVGIIGAGGIAQYYHVPHYQRCGNVQIVAACDVSETALEQIKAKCGVGKLYRDYQEMLDQEKLDLISICTSNDMHHPVALAAIAQGIDVYCEKPLALNYAQAKEMYVAAQAKGIKTGVNFSHRRTPAAQLAREIISSGALGRIHYVSAVYAAGGTNYAQHKGTWRNDREKAGFGGMGDMGAHMLDMMMWWLDSEVTHVAAQTCTVVPEVMARDTGKPMQVTTEDQGTLLLSYANGAMGYLCGSYIFTGRGYDQRVEIYGAEGGLMYNQQHPNELEVYLPADFLKRYEVLRQGGAKDTPYTTIHVPERLQGLLPNEPGASRGVLMDFIDAYCAEGLFSFKPGFYEGMKVQEVLEASRRGEASRCWVSLPL
jgi:predicted dehydrogenase